MDTTIPNADENLDSPNEENAETVEENEEEVELDLDDQEEQPAEEGKPTEDEARKQRRETTIDRLKKERDEWKAKAESSRSAPVSTDDALLARLELRGVTEPEDQAEVLRYAKAEGKSPVEIINDDFMKSRLDHLKRQREQRQASQTPGNRSGVPSKSVDYYINRNELPKDPAMAEKVQQELARRAKESA